MFFLIKLIFKLATLAVFIFIGVVVYSFLTGKNIEVGGVDAEILQEKTAGDA